MAEEANEPIEVYADSVQLEANVYGMALKFGLSGSDPKTSAVVRMSPQMVHILARLLVRASNDYDTQVGKVIVPDSLYDELGLKKEL